MIERATYLVIYHSSIFTVQKTASIRLKDALINL